MLPEHKVGNGGYQGEEIEEIAKGDRLLIYVILKSLDLGSG